jgi:RNA polymerase sigma factor for flagellar operon FliA
MSSDVVDHDRDQEEDRDAVALWAAYQASGDVGARNRIVLRYSPLVKYVVGRVRAGIPQSVDSGDLLSDGFIGLMDAVDKFQPERGLKFQTYAVPRIRGAILDGMRKADWVPRSVRSEVRGVERARVALQHRLGRTPDDSEIAEEMGITLPALQTLYSKAANTGVSHLDETEVGEESLPGAVDIDTEAAEVRTALVTAIRQLPERDQVLMTLYYFEGLTLSEIGQVLQVTESRISQLHSRCTAALRAHLVDDQG